MLQPKQFARPATRSGRLLAVAVFALWLSIGIRGTVADTEPATKAVPAVPGQGAQPSGFMWDGVGPFRPVPVKPNAGIGQMGGMGQQNGAPAQLFRNPPQVLLAQAPGGGGTLFFTDRTLHRRLIQAEELLTEKEPNFVEAARALQSVLDHDEDSFFPSDPNDKTRFRGIKDAAMRLIGDMPAAGRKTYEDQYGSAARQLLQDAITTGDSDGIAAVARRFFHTKAGYEATYRVATEHLDHARPLAAALCFERLLKTTLAREQFEPWLSVKAALAWERAAHHAEAVQTLVDLRRRHPGVRVEVGGRKLDLPAEAAQTSAWLAGAFGAEHSLPRGQDQWPTFRGDAARNASGRGGSPYLNGGWQTSLVASVGEGPQEKIDDLIRRFFSEKVQEFHDGNLDRNYAALPSGHPLVVHDLVIARDYGLLRAFRVSDGKLAWVSADRDKTLREVAENTLRTPYETQTALTQHLSILLTQRAWRDATWGTLSSDGAFVFAIEDTSFLGPWGNNPSSQHPLAPRMDNRLVAYDVRTGSAAWEVGGPKEYADELAGAYFLGAPLVLDRLLYCLAEVDGDIRLLVLDPRNGNVEWAQTLLRPEASLAFDAHRRMAGVSPSFAGGVLVCPTEAGAAIAVDLTTRSLLWRYVYQTASNRIDPRMMGRGGFRDRETYLNARMQAVFGNDPDQWLDATTTVADGKVLLTPRERDANFLHCLNLIDGSVVWKKNRGEGLYIAGIHEGNAILVGKSHIIALRMDDGEPAWSEPTTLPLPSGRGFISGNLYHVPLTTAEVATVDLTNGRLVTRTQSRDGRVPGNLVGMRGAIISQGVDMIDCFREMDTLETEIAERLKTNPTDAAALALRGEIYLHRGKTREAYADLRRVLEINSDDARVRNVLLGSLLEGLRVDFTTYRDATKDIEKLVTAPEQKSSYLRLFAAGLERAGERKAAFDIYLKFLDDPPQSAEVERVESALSIGRERLVRTKAAGVYEQATAAERTAIDAELRSRFESLQNRKAPEELQRLLDLFGGQFTSLEPRRELAKQLGPAGERLELERQARLLELAPNTGVSAEGTARVAQMLVDAGRAYDAVPSIRTLLAKPRSEPVLREKNTAQLVGDWMKLPDVRRSLSSVSPWPVGRVDVEKKPIDNNLDDFRKNRVPIVGSKEPFFTDVLLELEQNGQVFSARDAQGNVLWEVDLPFQGIPSNVRAQVLDHLVLVTVGTTVYAVDTLGTDAEPEARVLWQQALSEAAPGATPQVVSIRRAGGQGYLLTDQNGNPLGTVGPVTRDFVCVQRGRKLFALDPISGKTLWVRDDLKEGLEIFGDEEYVFANSFNGEEARVFRALDGVAIAMRMLPPVTSRLANIGRSVVTWASPPGSGEQILSLYDVWTREAAWKRSFAINSRIELIDTDEAAVLEPTGRFTIVSLANGKIHWSSMVESPRSGVYQMKVFRSAERYTVIANTPSPAVNGVRVAPMGPQNSSILVNGLVYGFDRATGKLQWTQTIERHGIDTSQLANLPVLTFVCSYSLYGRGGQEYGVLCLDQRNGRIVFNESLDEPVNVATPLADPDHKRLDIRLYRSQLQLTFTDKAALP